ncbi:hypothetical protein K474DRAFT_638702 [Panus rudis PR-1116 ss-1]|nr:hypothetical protein K474DRAFT_638702 [Panus rudis PR-1116 ss-1]
MPLSLLDERVAVWYRGIMAAIRSDARIRSYKVQFYFKGPEARELQQTPTEDLCASSRWAKKIEIYVERLSLPVAFDTIYFSGGNVVEIAYDRPGRQGNVRWSDEQDDEDEDGIDTNMEDEEGSEMYDDGNITQGDNVSVSNVIYPLGEQADIYVRYPLKFGCLGGLLERDGIS